MKVLALDTSTEYCSVALWCDGRIVERDIHAGQRHSQLLLGMVDEVLEEGGVALGELDGIAYGEGPGSFTGLRIACGVTQGLAYAHGLPVVGIGTLLAMAEEVSAERVVCAIDARMKEVYHAAYTRTESGWTVVHAPGLCRPDAVPPLPEGEWVACGSGFAAYREMLAARYANRVVKVVADAYPRARHIAQCSVPRFERGETVSAEAAVPYYIRDKVALRTDERTA
ncbi:MAG TPA: tRNA (adenosine(37)-N6)-threonylcarbamoyltransferase complex dimerization subunit type 1 TsaB [Burkholderiales bacterium]|nr:tRNA (adenosine(37)-N6)-threonylcarbamoyltransferase complex dimerization subunit type 1 TsaB [Burkholderiales bacterium]